MSESTYTVELTFSQWMDVVSAVGSKTRQFKRSGLDGEMHQFQELRTDIIEQVEGEK